MMKMLSFLALVISFPANAQSITATGDWTNTVNITSVKEAGKDYGANFKRTSGNNKTKVTLKAKGAVKRSVLESWRVDVSKLDINWHSDLLLEAQRTGDGTGTTSQFGVSSISGGTAYQTINNLATPFFNGNGNYTNIPIKYKVSGFSLLIPVDTYTTTVVYTYIEL